MRPLRLLALVSPLAIACTTAGKSGEGDLHTGDPGDTDAGGDTGDTDDGLRTLSGTVDCDGCSNVVIAVFDETGEGPLTDTVIEVPDPFSVSVADDTPPVWLIAFADDNGNHAPDPGEAFTEQGPYTEDTEDIVLTLEGGSGGGGDTVQISGTLSCFEGCHPPFVLGILSEGDTDWTPVGIVEETGDYTVEVPADLGVVDLFAVEDLNGTMDYEPPEELGGIEGIVVAGDDLTGIDIDIALDETLFESPGVEDVLGLPVAVHELIVYLDEGESVDGIAADLGGAVVEEIEGVGFVLSTGITESDSDPLAELAELEALAASTDGVSGTLRSAYVAIGSSREVDDNLLLSGADNWAFLTLRVADAKDLFHDCAIHLDASGRSLDVEVGIVDFDLQGVRDSSEFTGVVGSFTDHHTARSSDLETHGAHGSQVAAQIGAINGNGGFNGVLAGFTGSAADGSAYGLDYSLHLHNIGHQSREPNDSGVLVQRTTTTSGALLSAIGAALSGDSEVVNVSIGTFAGSMGHLRYIQGLRGGIGKVLDAHPTKILVFAAGNDNRDLGNGLHLTSMDKPNLVVVGATNRTDARASFSNHGRYVDVAAPGDGIWGFTQKVDHEGTSTTLGDSSYGSMSGTSFAAPITTATLAAMRAFDGSASVSSLLTRLERGADPITSDLGGLRVHTRRAVQFELEQQLNTTTRWLLDFDAELTAITGTGCAAELDIFNATACMPMVPSGGDYVLATGITDVLGNSQTIDLSLAGTASGAAVQMTIDGDGTSFGVGPATTVYTGSVGTDPHDPAPVPGDVYVSGTFSGNTDGHPDLDCEYEGEWEGWLRSSTP